MASGPIFPIEIFNLIIDELGQLLVSSSQFDDNYWNLRRTLYNLTLTWRGFRQSTRYLYHTLLLRSQPIGSFSQFNQRLDALAAALAIPGGPSTYVRKVTIIFFPSSFAGIGAIDGCADPEENAETEDDSIQDITGRWIARFMEALPHLLVNLSCIRHFRLESRLTSLDLTFGLIRLPARAAILECLRRNPLETFQVDRVTIPWEVLCALPASLQRLELGQRRWCIDLEVGDSAGIETEGSGDYLADKEMFDSEEEPPLAVRPRVMHLNLDPDFSKVIARQQRLFSHLNLVLRYTYRGVESLRHCHCKIVPTMSAHLQELILQLDTLLSGSDRLVDVFQSSLQSSLQSINSLPALTTLGFVFHHTGYSGRITCPPRFAKTVDAHISQTAFREIKVLRITGTWNLGQACYPPLSGDPIIDPFLGGWSALDASLAELPALEQLELTLSGEDDSLRAGSLAMRALCSQTEAEMASLFPETRRRGVSVSMACGLRRDSNLFSANVE
ncbi:hypothetical protein BKA70DRAFT_1560088 [Coprinopsis sp. MPI-PUGE-AT-0042]|nr:hypothetical protein BKA70DRAFT_1560088 [Coprinopsis sp. MPI-PUGE-AT-0042]